jgi:MoxR-like ATPase
VDHHTVRDSIVALQSLLRKNVIGQDRVADSLLIALLADGHVLLEGAPGLAKTRLARRIAKSFGGKFNRVQFTPDLLPSDLTGAAIYDAKEHRFEFRKGPIFTNFLLADEINRAPAKVQSALLEAMEERQVSSGETTYQLDWPFLTIATQNPIEHEGTWELPQAQLDRFIMHLRVDYPRRKDERTILDVVLRETQAVYDHEEDPEVSPVSLGTLRAAQKAISNLHISEPIRDFIVRLVAGTRSDPAPVEGVGEHLSHAISPRGSIALARTSQARAWLEGRDHVLPEDVRDLAPDVLRHRMGLTFRAEADGITSDAVVHALLDRIHVA